MSLTAIPQCIVEAAYVTGSDTQIYFTPSATKVIIDNFLVANNDSGGAHTLNVNIVASGGSVGGSNLVVAGESFPAMGSAGSSSYLPQMQYVVLNPGDFISVKSDTASKLVIRISGRLCS